MHVALCDDYDAIGHVTIRFSIDDLLYVLNRNLTRILLSFPDVITSGSTSYLWGTYIDTQNRKPLI